MRPIFASNSPLPRAWVGLLLSVFLLAPGVAVLGCGPSDPLEVIRRQQAAGDFEGSLEPLRKLLAERRDDAEIDFLYGRALILTGQASLAEWSLQKAMDDPDWLVPAGLQLARGALQTRNYEVAVEATGRILEVQPDNANALLMRANAYARMPRQYELALADVDRLLELDPDNAEALEPRILALLALERVDEAAAAIEDLGNRIEETELGEQMQGWHCATKALFTEESGETERAAELWDDCVARFPGHENVVTNAIQFYDSRGELDRSLEILRAAYEAKPSSRGYRIRLARRLSRAGEKKRADEILREAAEVESPSLAADAWMDLAKHHQEQGEYAAAAEEVERALELARQLGDTPPQLLLEYADALLLAGELDRALAVANDEITLPPHQEMIRARVAQERGRPAEALKHFDEAFRLWPDNPWARYYAAVAAEAIGDFDRAIEAYRYAMRLDAGETDARIRVARLHMAEGRPAEALQLLRFRADRKPLKLEGELLCLRLWARLGQTATIEDSLGRLRGEAPEYLGQALASVAEGVRDRAGPEAALRVLRDPERTKGLDLEDPSHADALRALVRYAADAGHPEEAEAAVRAAVGAHPDVAALREIEGLWLELRGAPPEEARRAYASAVELDAGNARALSGLGRLALEEDPEQALSFFDRADAADPSDADAKRGAARALAAAGRPQAAEERLSALLEWHPYDADAAAELARLRLARGAPTERTLELAKQAVRFGGGADALELLSRVYEAQNQPERAGEAAARARALRERRASEG